MADTRYLRQREKVTPPHVSLKTLRNVAGITLEALIERMSEFDFEVSVGALSAVENGHRGASEQLIEAIAGAYGIEADEITTTYQPKRWRKDAA